MIGGDSSKLSYVRGLIKFGNGNIERFALCFEAKRTKSTLTCTPLLSCVNPKRKNTMFLFVPTISVVSSFLYLRNKVTISNRDDYYQFFFMYFLLSTISKMFGCIYC